MAKLRKKAVTSEQFSKINAEYPQIKGKTGKAKGFKTSVMTAKLDKNDEMYNAKSVSRTA